MFALLGDLRFPVRMLARNPATTLFAIFTLTLAIGADPSNFSAVNAALLRPLPYPEPEQLLWFADQVARRLFSSPVL